MIFRPLSCTCLAIAAAPLSAIAAASASVSVSNQQVDVSVAVDTNTAAFDYGFLDVNLQPLETVSRTFAYTVTLHDDGLPAIRVDNVCTPDYRSDCGPAPTGLEQAYASIEIGRDRRVVDGDNAFLDDGNVVQTFQSITGMPRTYSGTLTYMGTDTSPYLPQVAHLQVMLYVLADVAALPEPASWWMALCGLSCIALRAPLTRRRSLLPATTC